LVQGVLQAWFLAGVENVFRKCCVSVGKPQGKRPPGRPRYRWEHNIKMYLMEIGCEIVDWIHLAQDRDK
jgi:hypothetical protein